ncbi:MAG: cobalamin biosynthesis protein CbiG, partial [Ruminococcus sp.]|nr:cobalamin biosynthesis protein CbiG [Ruminococcus sp.]
MNISVISLTENGRIMLDRISGFLKDSHNIKRYCFRKHTDSLAETFENIYQLTDKIFTESDVLIFICACGIAVRAVASH